MTVSARREHRLSSAGRNWLVFFGVAGFVALAAIAWLIAGEITDERIRVPLRRSADLAFLVFLVIFVARPLHQILRATWTARLLRTRRLLGVAFVAVMTTHLALIAYRFGINPDLNLDFADTIPGILAYALFYLMFITSFDGPARALGRTRWKILHWSGLIAATVAFVLPSSLSSFRDPAYLAFAVPFAIALIVRITAWQLSKRRDIQRSPQ